MKILILTFLILRCYTFAETPEVKENSPEVYTVKDYGFKRVFEKVKKDPRWEKSKLISEKLMLINSFALKYSVVSNPVSDRYMITCYGGSIDLVHFTTLASNICSGKFEWKQRLYQEWIAEGGNDNLQSFNYSQPPEAHPDDLPSNALGALWGSELKKFENQADFDLETAFEKFVTPLIPVPDKIVQHFSHEQIVMGFYSKPSRALMEERYGWFTAKPLIQTEIINKYSQKEFGKNICENFKDGKDSLNKAGFLLAEYKTQFIIILRK